MEVQVYERICQQCVSWLLEVAVLRYKCRRVPPKVANRRFGIICVPLHFILLLRRYKNFF